jgi:hypothetical protein
MEDLADGSWYEIRVRGVLGSGLLQAFPLLTAWRERTETVLRGRLPDQAALYGILAQLEKLNLELIAVQRRPARDP